MATLLCSLVENHCMGFSKGRVETHSATAPRAGMNGFSFPPWRAAAPRESVLNGSRSWRDKCKLGCLHTHQVPCHRIYQEIAVRGHRCNTTLVLVSVLARALLPRAKRARPGAGRALVLPVPLGSQHSNRVQQDWRSAPPPPSTDNGL